MKESTILWAMQDNRDAWHSIQANLPVSTLSPAGQHFAELVRGFYEADPKARRCDSDILVARAGRVLENNAYKDAVIGIIQENALSDLQWASAINVAKEIADLRAHALALQVSSGLASGAPSAHTRALMEELQVLLAGAAPVSEETERFCGVKASDLVSRDYSKENLIQLYPKVLNEHIDGGVRGGHHILIFAPTEMGKTLFAINMCFGFLKQGLRVLYVGNEDPASDIIMRMMTRLTGMNKYDIMAHPDKADALLAQRNWDLFTFASFAPGTFPKIHKAIEDTKAQVVILDQLRNLSVDSENRTQAYERSATLARNTAKQYNIPVISITQAGDSASGRTVLSRGDVDGSNVGIPGQCDLMIGVGADSQMEQMNMRVLSFPKNKLSGKHTPIQVTIDPLLSKVVD